jgi:hypothetical protein
MFECPDISRGAQHVAQTFSYNLSITVYPWPAPAGPYNTGNYSIVDPSCSGEPWTEHLTVVNNNVTIATGTTDENGQTASGNFYGPGCASGNTPCDAASVANNYVDPEGAYAAWQYFTLTANPTVDTGNVDLRTGASCNPTITGATC